MLVKSKYNQYIRSMSYEVDPSGYYSEEYHNVQYNQSFIEILEGLALHDISNISSAVEILDEMDGPFMRHFRFHADLIESFCLDPNQEGAVDKVNVGLTNILRAYVYSGLRVNRAAVDIAVGSMGLDKKWLRDLIKPTDTLLDLIIRVETETEKNLLRYYGRRALIDLELASPYTKFLVWLKEVNTIKQEPNVRPQPDESDH